MPRLAPKLLELEKVEKAELEKILARHNTSQQVAKRAKIILMASEGKKSSHYCKGIRCQPKNGKVVAREMVQRIRAVRRLRRLGSFANALKEKDVPVIERLSDAPRSGKPTQFTTEQVLQLFALACEPPEKYGRPISHWTARELAEEMIEQKIVESISTRHVGRLLSEASLKPHCSEYWLNPPPMKSLMRKSNVSVNCTSKRLK